MKSNEEEVLELIKFALECNNDTLAIRHIEQYGFFKQGGYKQAESKQLNMHDVSSAVCKNMDENRNYSNTKRRCKPLERKRCVYNKRGFSGVGCKCFITLLVHI